LNDLFAPDPLNDKMAAVDPSSVTVIAATPDALSEADALQGTSFVGAGFVNASAGSSGQPMLTAGGRLSTLNATGGENAPDSVPC
jgi:hypothetical protein